MRKYANIVNNKIHAIYKYEKLPKFAPDFIMIDITDLNPQPQVGWTYDFENKTFIAPPKPTFDELKQQLIDKINNSYSTKVKEIASKYPDTERDTWSIQQSEWTEWIKNPSSTKTPFVDTLAQARGISREEMLKRIGENVKLFAYLLGLKQQFLDKAKKAKTEDELKNIEKEITKTFTETKV